MSSHLKSGMVLGDTYRLAELVGKGGMGEVWRAEHTRLPRQFAVKVLHGAAAANEVALARFRREAEIASRLGHANIVQVLDFNTLDDGTPYMVMELLEGESLRDRAKRGTLSLAEVVRILRQVASALRAAHRQGVVHRDLKPDNIFLCQEELEGRHYERAKVLDFGISKIQGSQTVVTRDAEVLGTPIYMAPEQAAGRHTLVDGRTDEFALAAIAYELLSGQIAFGGETLVEVVNKIMNGTPAPLLTAVPTLPQHVVKAIDRGLSKERDSRFPEITDFVDALAGDPGLMGTTTPDDDIPTEPRQAAALADAGFAATAASHDALPMAAAHPAAAAAPGDAAPSATDPATVYPERAPRRLGWILGLVAGAALLALGAVIATRAGNQAGAPTKSATPATDAGSGTKSASHANDASAPGRTVDAAPAAPATDATSGQATPSEDAAASAAPPKKVQAKAPSSATDGKTTRKPRTGRRIPAAAAADLAQAEAAIRRGNAADALHFARRSLQKHRSQRAFVVMVRAYCLRRDLRMSKAMLGRLKGATRRKAVRWCRKKGFDISGR